MFKMCTRTVIFSIFISGISTPLLRASKDLVRLKNGEVAHSLMVDWTMHQLQTLFEQQETPEGLSPEWQPIQQNQLTIAYLARKCLENSADSAVSCDKHLKKLRFIVPRTNELHSSVRSIINAALTQLDDGSYALQNPVQFAITAKL